jgi:hypothetical protein
MRPSLWLVGVQQNDETDETEVMFPNLLTGHSPPTATANACAAAVFPQLSTAYATATAYAMLSQPAVAEALAAASA